MLPHGLSPSPGLRTGPGLDVTTRFKSWSRIRTRTRTWTRCYHTGSRVSSAAPQSSRKTSPSLLLPLSICFPPLRVTAAPCSHPGPLPSSQAPCSPSGPLPSSQPPCSPSGPQPPSPRGARSEARAPRREANPLKKARA